MKKNKNSYNIKKSFSKKQLPGRRVFWVVIGAVVLGSLVFAAIRILSSDNPSSVSPIPTAQNSDDQDTSQAEKEKINPTVYKNSDKTSTTSNSTVVDLNAPSGTFVSSHHISLSKTTAVESVCNTTPGAMCSISFTNSSNVVRYLTEQKTDSYGATYWTWSPTNAKLTEGSWHILATSSANGQTKQTKDPMPLEVSP